MKKNKTIEGGSLRQQNKLWFTTNYIPRMWAMCATAAISEPNHCMTADKTANYTQI